MLLSSVSLAGGVVLVVDADGAATTTDGAGGDDGAATAAVATLEALPEVMALWDACNSARRRSFSLLSRRSSRKTSLSVVGCATAAELPDIDGED